MEDGYWSLAVKRPQLTDLHTGRCVSQGRRRDIELEIGTVQNTRKDQHHEGVVRLSLILLVKKTT